MFRLQDVIMSILAVSSVFAVRQIEEGAWRRIFWNTIDKR